MEGEEWITNCSKENTNWSNYEVLANRISLKSAPYCTYECEHNPLFCTHWTKERNHGKCTLYLGDIDAPSPGLIASGDNKEVHVGTRLCRRAEQKIHNTLCQWSNGKCCNKIYMFTKIIMRIFVKF